MLSFERSLMSDQLYNDEILKLSAELVKVDRLENPDASVSVDSPLCGSRVKVDINFSKESGCVTAYGQEVRACALGQSAAAIVAKHVVGSSSDELATVRQQVEDMLKKEGAAPTGKWQELGLLIPARRHKSRHASILLPFKGIEKAIQQIEQGQNNA